MTAVFRKERVPRITEPQWVRLGEYFAVPQRTMVHAIGNAVGLSYVLSNALALAMHTDGVAHLFLAVFHTCEPHPVDYRELNDGPIRTAWTCPECEQEVQPDELSYSLECRSATPIVFE